MQKKLSDILIKIGEEFKNQILPGSRFYLEVDIGGQAAKYGHFELGKNYHDIYAIVPLKRPEGGMKVRVDGRTFVNYVQFESGLVVPNFVANEVGLNYKTYIPNDSMIRNFA